MLVLGHAFGLERLELVNITAADGKSTSSRNVYYVFRPPGHRPSYDYSNLWPTTTAVVLLRGLYGLDSGHDCPGRPLDSGVHDTQRDGNPDNHVAIPCTYITVQMAAD